jgi:ketosteroid isomerase-like protein
LEDTTGDTSQLQTIPAFQRTIAAVADHISRKNLKIFLNIRTDAFLLGMPSALSETLTRIRNYETTGANGIFVPCITRKEQIKEVVQATALPINVMCMPGLPDLDELGTLGVKRVSMGSFFYDRVYENAGKLSRAINNKRNFSSILTLIAIFIFSCFSPCQAQTKKDRSELEEARIAIAASNAIYFQAFAKGDSSIFIDRYAKDCWIMPPNASALCGEEAPLEFFRTAYRFGLRNGKFITTDVFGDGKEYVTELGFWQSFDAAGKMFDNGKFLVLWKKTPNGWKMYRDSFSSDNLPAHEH